MLPFLPALAFDELGSQLAQLGIESGEVPGRAKGPSRRNSPFRGLRTSERGLSDRTSALVAVGSCGEGLRCSWVTLGVRLHIQQVRAAFLIHAETGRVLPTRLLS